MAHATVGVGMTRPYLNQGDPAWAATKCGLSTTTTIQQAGCVLTSLAIALRSLGLDPAATPVTVQTKALAAWRASRLPQPFATNSASAVIDLVGRASGLDVGAVLQGRTGRLWSTLMAALGGGRALLHVDTVDDGVDKAHHWVLALRLDGRDIVFADPDGGHEGRLPWDSLEGLSPKGKPYRVLALRTVAPLTKTTSTT